MMIEITVRLSEAQNIIRRVFKRRRSSSVYGAQRPDKAAAVRQVCAFAALRHGMSGECRMKSSPAIYLCSVLSVAVMQTAAIAQTNAPEIRFPEQDQANDGARPYGSTARQWLDPPSPPISGGPAAIARNRDNIADQLNGAELGRLLRGRDRRRRPFQ